ncbi:MAG: hypothetical protein V4819_00870, partial [Verrucomicrobiota bacterium]
MRTISLLLIALATLCFGQEPDDRVILVPLGKAPKEAPLFFSASADVKAQANLSAVTSEQTIDYKIHQGKPETLTLALTGEGEVLSVAGQGLRDWSVRVAEDGSRFLDVRPVLVEGTPLTTLQVQVKTRLKIDKHSATLLLPGPGPATGFSLTVTLNTDPSVELRVSKADGLVPVDATKGRKFLGYGLANVEIAVTPGGTGSRGLELMNASLVGFVAADGGSVSFSLTGTARAATKGSAAELFGGGAALSGKVAGDGWHVVLREKNGYDLVAERGGDLPVAIDFVVPVTRKGDWKHLDFRLPTGVVVPVALVGLDKASAFDRTLAVVPELQADPWRGFIGFLPANGNAAMAWREAGAVADGALFFSSTESTDVRIGSGLMRQLTVVDLRVLQGKLASLSLSLDGPGEVLAVTGEPVLGWSVVEDAGKR